MGLSLLKGLGGHCESSASGSESLGAGLTNSHGTTTLGSGSMNLHVPSEEVVERCGGSAAQWRRSGNHGGPIER